MRTERHIGGMTGRGPATVSLALRDRQLSEFLRSDLERSGFRVVGRHPDPQVAPPEIVVTDERGPTGRLLTVRLNGEVEVLTSDGEWWFPTSDLERLPEVLDVELERARDEDMAADRIEEAG